MQAEEARIALRQLVGSSQGQARDGGRTHGSKERDDAPKCRSRGSHRMPHPDTEEVWEKPEKALGFQWAIFAGFGTTNP